MSDKRESRPEADAVKIKTYDDHSKEADSSKEAVAETGAKSGKKTGKKAVQEMTAKLEAAEKKAGDHYDQFLRKSAEFENYKKRKDRETTDFRKYANEALVKELLPVIDNLERAMETSADHEDAVNCILEGVDMTLKEIFKVLEKFAVKAVTAVGNEFDPTYHQAVMQEETDTHPEKTVIKELQKGYTIHDRLLRPSMVVVAKAASE
ncbi:MAG: nucleotide exchange factor GrpE [Desulfobacterales bacterium]|nr:nucleotide exchange factor GrpE [Desulfobacterales bacterium]